MKLYGAEMSNSWYDNEVYFKIGLLYVGEQYQEVLFHVSA